MENEELKLQEQAIEPPINEDVNTAPEVPETSQEQTKTETESDTTKKKKQTGTASDYEVIGVSDELKSPAQDDAKVIKINDDFALEVQGNVVSSEKKDVSKEKKTVEGNGKEFESTGKGTQVDNHKTEVENFISNFFKNLKFCRVSKSQFEDLAIKLDKLGVSLEKMVENGDLQRVANGEKTNELYTTRIKLADGLEMEIQGKLVPIINPQTKKVDIAREPVLKEIPINEPFMGHTFSNTEKKMLQRVGHLNKAIELDIDGKKTMSLVNVDPLTKNINAMSVETLAKKMAKQVSGYTISDTQKEALLAGKTVYIDDYLWKRKSGATYKGDNYMRIDLNQSTKIKLFSADFGNELNPYKDLTSEQKDQIFNQGKEIQAVLKDDKGQKYKAYVRFNEKTGKLRVKPETDMKEVVVSKESEAQVQANNNGIATEKKLEPAVQNGEAVKNQSVVAKPNTAEQYDMDKVLALSKKANDIVAGRDKETNERIQKSLQKFGLDKPKQKQQAKQTPKPKVQPRPKH